ncbi:hypothetical protein [uncultured Caulobacter sp.]|uniref:hypothetical protein n=1 Tax=uncultured Caulobacter sp. TaxID=158749 RepID=UPI00262F29FE|nr:hypothetical protein [uncultured Caulobacter sp.]
MKSAWSPNEILIWLALSTIFISGIYVSTPMGVLYFSYILMLAVYIFMAIRTSSFGITSPYVAAYLITMFVSLVGLLVSSRNDGLRADSVVSMISKLSLALFFVAFYTAIYNLCGRKTRTLFDRYLKVAGFFAILGVVQQVIFVVSGFNILSFTTARAKNYGSFLGVSGLSVEPAFYACALVPAGAFYISNFIRDFKISFSGIIVITAILFSTSSLGYLGLFVAVALSILISTDIRRSWILAASLPLAVVAIYYLVSLEFFQLRLNDTIDLISSGQLTLRRGMNMSTYSNAVNTSIAFKSLSDNYGLGTGFGLYSSAFDRYIFGYEMPTYRVGIPGRGSGTSMFSRLTAELGIFAWLFFVAAIGWAWANISKGGRATAMHVGYLSSLVIILMRMGEYYANGVILVLVMIYLARQEIRVGGRVSRSERKAAVVGRLV